MSDKNWKYDYAGNQSEIEKDTKLLDEDITKDTTSVVEDSTSTASDIRKKYVNYDTIRNDGSWEDVLQQYGVEDLQKLAFNEETETKWVDFNVLKALLQELQKLIPVKEAIEKIMKGIQTIIHILDQVEKIIRYFAGVMLDLLSPWIVTAKMIIRQVRELLKEILDGIFKFEMLGSSVLMGVFSVPPAKNADIPLVTDAQGLYDKFDQMTYEWKNRPTATSSVHGIAFLPIGNALGIPSKEAAKRLRSADNMFKDFKKAGDKDAWDRKSDKFRSGEFRSAKQAWNDIYDTMEVYKELEALAKAKFGSPALDESIRDRDPVNRLNKLQKDMVAAAKSAMLKNELDNMLVMDGLSKTMYESNGLKKISSPKLNDFKVYIDKAIKKDTNSKKLKIEINGPRNNDVIIHRIYLQSRTRDSEFGDRPVVIYTNPRTLPLEVYKHTGSAIRTFTEDIKTLGTLYKSTATAWNKGEPVTVGSEGSIFKTIANLDYDYFDTSNSNDKDAIFLREVFLPITEVSLYNMGAASRYGGDNMIIFPGSSASLRIIKEDGKSTTELYKPRYNNKTGNAARQEATPWELTLDMKKLDATSKKAIEKAFNEAVENKPYRKTDLYMFIELLPGNAVLFDDTFLDDSIPTGKLFPAYWNNGNYGAYSDMFMVSHLVELETEQPASMTSNEWYGYNVGSRTMEDIIKMMAPKVWDAIADARKGIFDFLDYLDAIVDAMQDTVDNLASLMNQVANIVQYINSDFWKNLLNLLNELFFEDTPALYFAIWEGSSDRISDILKSGVRSRGIQDSINGGMVIYANGAQIISIFEILNIIGKMGKLVKAFEEKDEPGEDKFKPTGPMAPFGTMMDPFIAMDISPAPGRYNRIHSGQKRVMDGAVRYDFNPEIIGQTVGSDLIDKFPPTNIDQLVKMLYDSGMGMRSPQDFRDISLVSKIRYF